MKKGTKVSWRINGARRRGLGTTISDEVDGTILVSVEDFGLLLPANTDTSWDIANILLGPIGIHPVIHCTVSWLAEVNPIVRNSPAVG